MKLTTEQWAALQQAVETDDQERFEGLIREAARIFVAHARKYAIQTEQVRSFEHRGRRPYLITERIHR